MDVSRETKESLVSVFKTTNKERVERFIEWSVTYAAADLRSRGFQHPYSPIDVNYIAWQLLKVRIRGDELHRYDYDLDAAAAERYMYIRYVAGLTGDPVCYAAPVLYAATKIFSQMTGDLQKGQSQDGHPVLPANPDVVAWGHRGVADGLKDFKKITSGANYRPGSAVEALASLKYSPEKSKKIGNYATQVLNSDIKRYH